MFDSTLRTIIDPVLNPVGRVLASWGVGANALSWLGFGVGCLAAFAIATEHYIWGVVLLLISRLFDGLDGAVARANRKTDLGGFLDIVLDFAFYGMIPFAFIVADPQTNAVAGGLLLLVFYVNGASFLTYALMAEKQGITEQDRGSKSLLYTTGLAEASETIIVFCILCLFPHWFCAVAYVYAPIVAVTTASRFALAYKNFD